MDWHKTIGFPESALSIEQPQAQPKNKCKESAIRSASFDWLLPLLSIFCYENRSFVTSGSTTVLSYYELLLCFQPDNVFGNKAAEGLWGNVQGYKRYMWISSFLFFFSLYGERRRNWVTKVIFMVWVCFLIDNFWLAIPNIQNMRNIYSGCTLMFYSYHSLVQNLKGCTGCR